jgi:hypothetical protein
MNTDSGISLETSTLEIIPVRETSLDAVEFISFAMYRLWNPNNVPQRKAYSDTQTSNIPWPFDTIVSPIGTKDWYLFLVFQVYQIIHRSKIKTPFLFIALLYISRLRQHIPIHARIENEFTLFLGVLMISQKQHSDDRFTYKT